MIRTAQTALMRTGQHTRLADLDEPLGDLASTEKQAIHSRSLITCAEPSSRSTCFDFFDDLKNNATCFVGRIARRRILAQSPRWPGPTGLPEAATVLLQGVTCPCIGRAVEQLVISLPPKERACVLLKDVFDYTLKEIAELLSSTVGGIRAALHRGRSKLAALPEPVNSRRELNPELSRLCIST